MIIRVDGKIRGRLDAVPPERQALIDFAKNQVEIYLKDRSITKVVIVPSKVMNLITKEAI